MTYQDLVKTAEFLEKQIAASSSDVRLSLQPKLHKVLADMDAGGIRVPARLRELDTALTDEMVEAQFDNMPV